MRRVLERNMGPSVLNRRWYWLGLVVIAASVPFHQPLLIVIGLLILIVVGTTDIWVTYCLEHVHYSRQFSEQKVLFGEEITLSLSVENAKLLPLPWLEVEDRVPRALTMSGQRSRVSLIGDTVILDNLFSTRWYERVTRRYTVRCNMRRVHWKATAHTMQLQSKVYEATTTYTLVLFLNVATYIDAIHGIQPEIQELSICAAASVADWALNEGYAVGLYANTLMFLPEEQV